jgi:predicted DsbA family dithiol-disulfide isomerase
MTRNTGPQDGVRLEVWFDFAYPWCFIAERRVRRALERASVRAELGSKSSPSNVSFTKLERVFRRPLQSPQ